YCFATVARDRTEDGDWSQSMGYCTIDVALLCETCADWYCRRRADGTRCDASSLIAALRRFTGRSDYIRNRFRRAFLYRLSRLPRPVDTRNENRPDGYPS